MPSDLDVINGSNSGVLSDHDIKQILGKEIVISSYDEINNLTDIGYNFTPTEFIFSINKSLLVPIYNDNGEKYCWISPHDTVLIITREAVWVSKNIIGTFHSKVKLVSRGFGHISTTLDPNWQGPLLISMNNPTNKRLKFVIGYDKGSGYHHQSFVTLIFYRLLSAPDKPHDNPSCRWDVLTDIVHNTKPTIFNYNNYMAFDNIVNRICNFTVKTVDLGHSDETKFKKDVDQFTQSYDEFNKEINFLIEQAHEISRKISSFESVKWWIKTIGIGLSILILLLLSIITDQKASWQPIFVPIAVTLLGFLLNQIHNKSIN